jgi:tryptophan-rich sensory protein
MKIDYVKLIISLVVCQMAGVIGSIFTVRSVTTWYLTLKKPFFTPPSWVFGPAWITLFVLMGIALYRVWAKGTPAPAIKIALTVFFVQLLFNVLWSIAFFGLRNPLLGLLDIGLLWILILVTLALFFRVDRAAGLLLVPYLLWVSFASVLNGAIYFLNR